MRLIVLALQQRLPVIDRTCFPLFFLDERLKDFRNCSVWISRKCGKIVKHKAHLMIILLAEMDDMVNMKTKLNLKGQSEKF